jgi:hypothetical protein
LTVEDNLIDMAREAVKHKVSSDMQERSGKRNEEV